MSSACKDCRLNICWKGVKSFKTVVQRINSMIHDTVAAYGYQTRVQPRFHLASIESHSLSVALELGICDRSCHLQRCRCLAKVACHRSGEPFAGKQGPSSVEQTFPQGIYGRYDVPQNTLPISHNLPDPQIYQQLSIHSYQQPFHTSNHFTPASISHQHPFKPASIQTSNL